MSSQHDGFRNGAVAAGSLSPEAIESLTGLALLDRDRLRCVSGVSTPDRLMENRVVFIDRFVPELAAALAQSSVRNVLVVAVEDYRTAIPQARLISSRPRVEFTAIVRRLFEYRQRVPTESISPSARIDASAMISSGVAIGDDCEIGAGTFIYPNVTIADRVRIGKNCYIKSGSVIGQPGFGVYRDADGIPYTMPHVGGVIIGNDVEIGALNTVASGTIHPTVIEDHVKTDDHVHIAHNCMIGSRTLITACAELSGSVTVGADCWIGPNASVRDGLAIGKGAFVGIGANVVSSVPETTTVVGNPARPVTHSKA